MVAAGISVARAEPRNRKITRTTMTMVSTSVRPTLASVSRMKTASS
jgi:hypothetical protein